MFFEGLEIQPSLLHGNLWSRKWGADTTGRAVVYDPAAYFGHNEMKLAMLTLFGGPSKGRHARVCAFALLVWRQPTQFFNGAFCPSVRMYCIVALEFECFAV